MKVCLVGEGAQGVTHINTLKKLDDIEVVTLAGGIRADLRLGYGAAYPHQTGE